MITIEKHGKDRKTFCRVCHSDSWKTLQDAFGGVVELACTAECPSQVDTRHTLAGGQFCSRSLRRGT